MAKNNEKVRPSSCACSERRDVPVPWLTAFLLFWPVAVIGAVLDLWSKSAVFDSLSNTDHGEYTIIDGFFKFIWRENAGAAFSAFQGWTTFLIAISCIALIVVIAIFFSHKVTCRLALFAMGCITAGIVGNLYDRLFNDGRVRDFIDVYVSAYHWPTFNVADSLLCIGVGLLIFSTTKTYDINKQ